MYGSAAGLTSVGAQVFHQDSSGVLNSNEPGDRFGESLASGDLNNDGLADIIVGVPREVLGGKSNTGRIHVFFGSPSGLTANSDESWSQNSEGVPDTNQKNDRFGAAVAAGDFNNDGAWDAAIGAPGEGLGGDAGAGTVFIIEGSLLGLTSVGSESWNQDRNNIKNAAEKNDHYGESLTYGDFNNDGFADLGVGVPGEGIGGVKATGAVSVLFGSADGLSGVGDKLWHQDKGGIPGVNQKNDFFGTAVAGGDFDGDGFYDLAIGNPKQDVGGLSNAGEITVIYGSAAGLTSDGSQRWNRETAGVIGTARAGAEFGSSVAAFDGNGDGYDDLGIGVPHQKVAGFKKAGATLFMRGSASGITGGGDRDFTQNKPGMADGPGTNDNFGGAL